MEVKYILTLITGVLECLLFSGIVFGWSSIVNVLKKEGYFSKLCEDDVTITNLTTSSALLEVSISTTNYEAFGGNNLKLMENSTYETTGMMLTDLSLASSNNGIVDTDHVDILYPNCNAQAEQLNLVFTIASTLLSFSTLLNGYIYDKFGTWISRIIALGLFTLGCVLMVVSTVDTSWLLFPAMSSFAVGGILILVTNLQIGNLFGRMRSSVITMMSGALDSSSSIFLLYKILYDGGVALTAIFHVTAWCTILLWLRTFLLLPKYRIPFPIKKGFNYGIVDCKVAEKKMQDTELVEWKDEDQISADKMETKFLPESIDKDLAPLNNKGSEALTEENSSAINLQETDISFLTCIKTSYFWTNLLHFSTLQLRNYFFMGSLVAWLKPLTGDGEELSSYLVAFGTCQLFGIVFAPLNGLMIDVVSRMLAKSTTCRDLIPRKAAVFSAIATSLLGTIFSVIIVVPFLPLQYLSFILQVVFRSFLYGGNINFIAVAFPGMHFGKLYGVTMTLAGFACLLQYPLFTLVMREFSGDFFVMNIIFVFVSLFTLLHPANVYIDCKKKEKERAHLDS